MISDASYVVANLRTLQERYNKYKRSQHKKLLRNTLVVTAAVFAVRFRRLDTSHRIMRQYHK